MGILNVTPDSFSDGGRYADVDARRRRRAGDGGGRRRPDRRRRRVDPPRRAAGRCRRRAARASNPWSRRWPAGAGAPSPSTRPRRLVARAAIDAGAVDAQRHQRAAARPGARRRRRRRPARRWSSCTCAGCRRTCTAHATYGDVMAEVAAELAWQRRGRAGRRRRRASALVIDPGIGFAKRAGPELGRHGPTRPRRAARPSTCRCSSARRASRSCRRPSASARRAERDPASLAVATVARACRAPTSCACTTWQGVCRPCAWQI